MNRISSNITDKSAPALDHNTRQHEIKDDAVQSVHDATSDSPKFDDIIINRLCVVDEHSLRQEPPLNMETDNEAGGADIAALDNKMFNSDPVMSNSVPVISNLVPAISNSVPVMSSSISVNGKASDNYSENESEEKGGNTIEAVENIEDCSQVSCFLCLENFLGRNHLEKHLMQVHSVKPETLASIMTLVQVDKKSFTPQDKDANTSQTKNNGNVISSNKTSTAHEQKESDDLQQSTNTTSACHELCVKMSSEETSAMEDRLNLAAASSSLALLGVSGLQSLSNQPQLTNQRSQPLDNNKTPQSVASLNAMASCSPCKTEDDDCGEILTPASSDLEKMVPAGDSLSTNLAGSLAVKNCLKAELLGETLDENFNTVKQNDVVSEQEMKKSLQPGKEEPDISVRFRAQSNIGGGNSTNKVTVPPNSNAQSAFGVVIPNDKQSSAAGLDLVKAKLGTKSRNANQRQSSNSAQSGKSLYTSTAQISPPITFLDASSHVDRPFRCPVCKVCYSLKQELAAHFESAQHQNRSAKAIGGPPNVTIVPIDAAAASGPSKRSSSKKNGPVLVSQPPLMTPPPMMDVEQMKYINNWLRMQQSQFLSPPPGSGASGLYSPTFAPMFGPAGMFPGFGSMTSPMTPGPPRPSESKQAADSSVASQCPPSRNKQEQRDPHGVDHGGENAYVKQDDNNINTNCNNNNNYASKNNSITANSNKSEQPGKSDSKSESKVANANLSTSSRLPLGPRKQDSYGKLTDSSSLGKFLCNVGFECVMQFNENNQEVKSPTSTVKPATASEVDSNTNDGETLGTQNGTTLKSESPNAVINDENANITSNLPELQKSTCLTCYKEFSSVWVLKAHQEEIHKEIVPHDHVAAFADDLRESYARKNKRSTARKAAAEAKAEATHAAATKLMKEFESKQEATPVSAHLSVSTASMAQSTMAMPRYSPLAQASMAQSLAAQMMQFPLLMSMNMLPQMMHHQMLPPMLSPEFFALQSQLMQYPPIDPSGAAAATARMMQQQQQQQQPTQQQQQPAANASKMTAPANLPANKSARTRINEEQLVVLREHFDINNSPGEDQIRDMSERTNLPAKVIKHWFRNTLFKERQRNKDSPYNFSVPPSTTLSLAEYDNRPLNVSASSGVAVSPGINTQATEPTKGSELKTTTSVGTAVIATVTASSVQNVLNSNPSISVSGKFGKSSTLPTTNSYAQMSSSITQSSMLRNNSAAVSIKCEIPQSSFLPLSNCISTVSNGMALMPMNGFSSGQFPVHMHSKNGFIGSDSENHLNNRTRFSTKQVTELQEFFARNTYPREDEMSMLSQRLNLSLRVVATWFQNARQKMRRSQEKLSGGGRDFSTGNEASDYASESESNANGSRSVGTKRNANASFTKSNTDDDDNSDDGDDDDSEDLKFIKYPMLPGVIAGGDEENRAGNPAGKKKSAKPWPFGSNKSLGMSSADEESEMTTSGDGVYEVTTDGKQRTRIRPDQLRYLYERYLTNTFPSSTDLEDIARVVELNKSVVQIWYQNTRARERKRQQQTERRRSRPGDMGMLSNKIINSTASSGSRKRLHELTASLGSERGLDRSPLKFGASASDSRWAGSSASAQQAGGYRHQRSIEDVQLNMQKLYEESMRNLTANAAKNLSLKSGKYSHLFGGGDPMLSSSSSSLYDNRSDMAPLDLSVASRSSAPNNLHTHKPPVGSDDTRMKFYMDDSRSETYSETDEQAACEQYGRSLSGSGSSATFNNSKRYRTQMSDLQIQVMRTIFADSKMPTISECEMLGRELGLPRRVVQVWFQNARAKEKKAFECGLPGKSGFGADGRQGGSGMGSDKSCPLCGTAYTAQLTQQDHLYSKGHVAKVKALVVCQDFVRAGSPTLDFNEESACISAPHDLTVTRNQSLREVGAGRVGKHKRRAHKQTRDENAPFIATTSNNNTGGSNTASSSAAAAAAAAAAQLLSSSGNLPADLLRLMPFMYPGAGAYYSGSGGMPYMPPDMNMPMSGLMYDPASFGIQLSMLKIPEEAIRRVEERIKDRNCSVTHYTQDCLTFADLMNANLSADDLGVAGKAFVDVGYICKRCGFVCPRRDDCVTHQRSRCYAGSSETGTMLKLEQMQYECMACKIRHSTIDEYRKHCKHRRHCDVMKSLNRAQRTESAPHAAAAIVVAQRAENATSVSSATPDVETAISMTSESGSTLDDVKDVAKSTSPARRSERNCSGTEIGRILCEDRVQISPEQNGDVFSAETEVLGKTVDSIPDVCKIGVGSGIKCVDEISDTTKCADLEISSGHYTTSANHDDGTNAKLLISERDQQENEKVVLQKPASDNNIESSTMKE